MLAARFSLSFVLAAALLAGCDDKKTDTNTNKTDSGKTVPSAEDVKKAADAAKAKADEATKTAADAKAKAEDATKTAADATKNAADATKTATDTAKANASEWMTKLQDAIKDKKLDDAKTYLDKLEAIKSSLPADLQTKLDSLKATYDAAKGGVPAIPGLNK